MVESGQVGKKCAEKAKKRFFLGKMVTAYSEMLKIPRMYCNFSLRVEWRKRQISETVRWRDIGSRNENSQNLALCQISKFYAKKYSPKVTFAVESIFDTLEDRWAH